MQHFTLRGLSRQIETWACSKILCTYGMLLKCTRSYCKHYHCSDIWASSWENVSSGVSDQVRLKLTCSATEASMRLEILVTETSDVILSRQRTTKALIRLRGCAGWSEPLLFAYNIRHVFSWPGSFVLKHHPTHISNYIIFICYFLH